MTGADVVDRAYQMVSDVGGTKRNSVADMVGFLNDGIRDLLARRPYFLVNSAGAIVTAFTDLTTDNYEASTLPFNDDWIREPLAHYIAHRVFELDAEDEFNAGQSALHLTKYMRGV